MGFGFDPRHHHFGYDLQHRHWFHGRNDGRDNASDVAHQFLAKTYIYSVGICIWVSGSLCVIKPKCSNAASKNDEAFPTDLLVLPKGRYEPNSRHTRHVWIGALTDWLRPQTNGRSNVSSGSLPDLHSEAKSCIARATSKADERGIMDRSFCTFHTALRIPRRTRSTQRNRGVLLWLVAGECPTSAPWARKRP